MNKKEALAYIKKQKTDANISVYVNESPKFIHIEKLVSNCITVDTPTVNDRIFPRDEMQKALDIANGNSRLPSVLLNKSPVNGLIDVGSIVGFCSNLHINEDGHVCADVRTCIENVSKEAIYFVVEGIEIDKRVTDIKFIAFYVLGDE